MSNSNQLWLLDLTAAVLKKSCWVALAAKGSKNRTRKQTERRAPLPPIAFQFFSVTVLLAEPKKNPSAKEKRCGSQSPSARITKQSIEGWI